MTRNTDTAVQRRPTGPVAALKHFLTARTEQLSEWVTDGVDPRALVRFALFEVQQSPQLQKCTPASIYLSLLACAQVGLEPGGVKQEAFIVPYKDQATFQLGWRGIVKLARRSGEITALTANVAHEHDDFDFDLGSEPFVRHRPALADRGRLIGAYAFAKLKTGELDVEWMSLADLEKIRGASHGGPAWKDWADQMYRKAPIRRLGKRLPLGGDYMLGARLDELAEGNDLHGYRQVLESTGAVIDVEAEEPRPLKSVKGVAAAKRRLAATATADDEPPPHGADETPPEDDPPAEAEVVDELGAEVADIAAKLDTGKVTKGIKARIRKLPEEHRIPLMLRVDEIEGNGA
jgi:recombination protein RecT